LQASSLVSTIISNRYKTKASGTCLALSGVFQRLAWLPGH
jgi:hypothetical protein